MESKTTLWRRSKTGIYSLSAWEDLVDNDCSAGTKVERVGNKVLQGLKLVSSSSRCPEKDSCRGTPFYTLGLDQLYAILIPSYVQSNRMLSCDLLIQLGSQARKNSVLLLELKISILFHRGQDFAYDSLELRELEKKLKSAYMNKERAAQIAEKEAIQYEKMKREAEIAQKMKEEYERVIKEESSAELRRNEEKKMYQQELEKQLEEQERKKQDAYQEFLSEKLLIDEIVRKIYEEDQMEKQLKLDKIRATRTYIEEFKKEQANWRRRKQEEMEEENRKIMEFANIQRQREEDWMAKVRDTEEKKQRLQSMIAQNLEREKQKREELEQIRQELYLEEQEETERKKEMAEIEKRIRQRLDLRQTYEEQFALKKILQQAMREEEEAFRQQMLAKLAEDDRIEQMNAQKRRMKQLEHRRAVEKLIEDRHKQFIADKGIIKDEDDVNMLGEEFQLAYQKRTGNAFSEEK
ncbi:hypothetical protein llap_1737 [Limosa lapponica baueri]|uniref:Meiosis-specific nuclear structural protein 1 n=1 Tax=Limosa lapponica baueri TaxID=1758121 RepID=A0A2I0UPI8_LIMLA|nr:hypothetical protein llap_1737 [Limosa lapponica baueri]